MERDGTTTPKQQSELEMPPGNYSCWGKAAISGSFFTPLPRFCRKSGRGGKKKQIAPCELPIPADTSVGCSESHHSSRFPSSGKFGSEESRETLQLAISRLILINDQFSRIKRVAICARD